MCFKSNINKKIGRNDKCPCGSGRKYKHCHGLTNIKTHTFNELDSKLLQRMKALEKQREKQQGLGRPIISAYHNGRRFVAVKNRLYHSANWKTFHDFLLDYLSIIFGSEWFKDELQKKDDEQHPVIQWHISLRRYLEEYEKEEKEIYDAPMTGVAESFLGLSYNLYLIAHNVIIQDELIRRLKDRNQFHGALYETYVAALLIKAGYELEFEDETNPDKKHCEFSAIKGSIKYSVEAKSRQPNKSNYAIGNQLYNALRKDALYQRIIFINMNIAEDTPPDKDADWYSEVKKTVYDKQATMTIEGKPAPEAYIFITNFPHSYYLDSTLSLSSAGLLGFKIKEMQQDITFNNLRQMIDARDKHIDVIEILKSIKEHYDIPSTFEGEIAEIDFSKGLNRLLIGEKYIILDKAGNEVIGELAEAIVIEDKQLAWGVYKLENGQNIIATCPLTDAELAAYRKHPETFFGKIKEQNKEITSSLEFYDFLYNTYQYTPKEKLLEFLQGHPQINKLRNLSQKELAKFYCESIVNANYSKLKETNKEIK